MSTPNEGAERARSALKPIRTILVGSSLEEGSDAVVGAAVDVARAAGGRLEILHALPMEVYLPRSGSGWEQADYQQKWSDAQLDELAAQVERLDIAVPMSSRVATGSPYRMILEAAKTTGADLIVVGANDRDGLGRFLGGTADRVLRGARCPVLVVRGEWSLPVERVLAPTDFSLLAADALECGLAFLRQLGGTKTEVELFYAVGELQRTLAQPFSPEQIEKFALEELEDMWREHAGAPRIRRSSRVGTGPAASEILKEAARLKTDLVMLGTHGRGGFERAFLGSVARAVATESPCPVLVIPPETAMGASVAEAVLEQTEPHWRVPSPEGSTSRQSPREGGSS